LEDLRNYINSVRRDFSSKSLDEKHVPENPYKLFEKWFEEAVSSQILDPYAMVIATVNKKHQPSTRVVYMRDISENGLVFYTNYHSDKAKDLDENKNISALFFWIELERQIKITGVAEKTSNEMSDAYFASRPRESQIGAWASNQSSILSSRSELEEKVLYYTKLFEGQSVPRPEYWGGYLIKPHSFEFWQGRPNRLHDRIIYTRQSNNWIISRLSP
jgi:pyridoxamine 5'-phosphate oxidase